MENNLYDVHRIIMSNRDHNHIVECVPDCMIGAHVLQCSNEIHDLAVIVNQKL